MVRVLPETWRTWDEFCVLAKVRWGSRLDLQKRIQSEVRQRYQQPDEPARAYITCLETLLMKLEPPPETSRMIEVLYENMLPNLKRIVRREDCRTITDLLER